MLKCFNPSVGILFVHTRIPPPAPSCAESFQSLGRDSVCSYRCIRQRGDSPVVVSIPRSGFCLFILGEVFALPDDLAVSIPRSGFCLFIRPECARALHQSTCFNPSVGILFVHTWPVGARQPASNCFNPSVGILFVHTTGGFDGSG